MPEGNVYIANKVSKGMDTIESLATYVPVRNWHDEDQPRHKLVFKGTDTMSDAELLALLLNTGYKQKSALLLAQEILHKSSNNLQELGKLTVSQLKKLKGIGEAKAAVIVAAMELARRRQAGYILHKQRVRSGQEAALYFKPRLGDAPFEALYTLYLNHACKVLKDTCICKGGITSAPADLRLIMREALELGATSIILCHNHPSGNLCPSQADILFTQKVIRAAGTLDIQVLDHVIVSEVGYFSMHEEGLITDNQKDRYRHIRESPLWSGFSPTHAVIA